MTSQPLAGKPVTRDGQLWNQRLFDRVDSASAVFFRVAFGGLLAKWAWDYMETGRVRQLYIEPAFHFTYYGFDWIQPWPGEGMLYHFVGLFILSVCIAVGFCYRASSLLFALGFTYVFLLDRTNYQNHYYLIGLIAWWLPWLPLNRNVAVDAWLWPALRCQTIPVWALWMLRFHVGLPYFFGGIAKLNADWMQGEPLGQMLSMQHDLPIVGNLPALDGISIALAWAALLYDLLVVPALLYRKTCPIAFAVCIVFHLMNSIIFNIHVFPWFMLLATPIFFAPDWPRRVLGGSPLKLPSTGLSSQSESRIGDVAEAKTFSESSAGETLDEFRYPKAVSPAAESVQLRSRRWIVTCCTAYVIFQCVWPLRHHIYPGDASWNERGHYFAWRMMLRGKTVVLGYALCDQVTGKLEDGQVNRFINAEQSEKFGRDPEMVLQFAHFLGEEYQRVTGHEAEVHVLALASLNGRKPVLMIDPNIDLMREPRGFYQRQWLLPQTEPLQYPHWDIPPEQWRQHVEIPELRFMARASPHVPEAASKQLAKSD